MTTKTTGSFNNNTTPPVDAQYLNIQRDEMNALCVIDGTTLDGSGLVNSQQAQAVKAYVSQAGILCTDSGSSANSYILTASSPFTNPPLKTGTRVRFKTPNANNGSSTIAAFGGSAITCKKSDGSTNLGDGDIPANTEVEFVYNGTNFVQVLGRVPATTTTQGVAYLLPNRNILINGAMAIDQRNAGASQTITAGSALAYTVDRWYAYCTGANATGQRVAGTAPNQYNYRFTGASSITKIGFAQRIEASNSQHLAGKTATLSVDLANSLLTTITWVASYATTADSFGTIASPTKTQIATGTFTVNSTLTRYATSIAIPAGATTGIEIEFSVGAQTSGTWTIGRAQLEDTPEQTTFEYRPIQQELSLCERYFEKSYDYSQYAGALTTLGMIQERVAGTSLNITVSFRSIKRTAPSVVLYNPTTGTAGEARNFSQGINVAFTAFNINDKAFLTDRNDLTDNNQYGWHFVANAEL